MSELKPPSKLPVAKLKSRPGIGKASDAKRTAVNDDIIARSNHPADGGGSAAVVGQADIVPGFDAAKDGGSVPT